MMPSALNALGFAPEIEALMADGVISQEYADDNRRLSVLLVGFMMQHLANNPEVLAMFEANDREHFIEGMLARRRSVEKEWAEYLISLRS